MRNQLIRLTITLTFMLPSMAFADSIEHEVDQKNKAFSIDRISINVGEKIKFVNSDSYFHNVYSLSDTAQFDLGSYPKGDSRTITFDKAGTVIAKCAIHPKMQLKITIEEQAEGHEEDHAKKQTEGHMKNHKEGQMKNLEEDHAEDKIVEMAED